MQKVIFNTEQQEEVNIFDINPNDKIVAGIYESYPNVVCVVEKICHPSISKKAPEGYHIQFLTAEGLHTGNGFSSLHGAASFEEIVTRHKNHIEWFAFNTPKEFFEWAAENCG